MNCFKILGSLMNIKVLRHRHQICILFSYIVHAFLSYQRWQILIIHLNQKRHIRYRHGRYTETLYLFSSQFQISKQLYLLNLNLNF